MEIPKDIASRVDRELELFSREIPGLLREHIILSHLMQQFPDEDDTKLAGRMGATPADILLWRSQEPCNRFIAILHKDNLLQAQFKARVQLRLLVQKGSLADDALLRAIRLINDEAVGGGARSRKRP